MELETFVYVFLLFASDILSKKINLRKLKHLLFFYISKILIVLKLFYKMRTDITE